jgi:hypothetical protein
LIEVQTFAFFFIFFGFTSLESSLAGRFFAVAFFWPPPDVVFSLFPVFAQTAELF